jgi:hypothetical protein
VKGKDDSYMMLWYEIGNSEDEFTQTRNKSRHKSFEGKMMNLGLT